VHNLDKPTKTSRTKLLIKLLTVDALPGNIKLVFNVYTSYNVCSVDKQFYHKIVLQFYFNSTSYWL